MEFRSIYEKTLVCSPLKALAEFPKVKKAADDFLEKLSLARAIDSVSPVLLLDEATSALDERTEKQLLENLRSMTDKTVVIVTHRPAALEICDRTIDFTDNKGGSQ